MSLPWEKRIATPVSTPQNKYMARKVIPYKPEDWHDIVTKATEIMNENNIWPLIIRFMVLAANHRN